MPEDRFRVAQLYWDIIYSVVTLTQLLFWSSSPPFMDLTTKMRYTKTTAILLRTLQ